MNKEEQEAERQVNELSDRLSEECQGEDLMVVITASLNLIAETIEELENKRDQMNVIDSAHNALVDLSHELECDIRRNSDINLH